LNAILSLTQIVASTPLQPEHLSRRSKVTKRNNEVKLIACDQALDLLYYLRKGEIDSIIVENTFEMGYRAMKLINAGQRGESILGNQLLPPTMVTRENVDRPDVQRMLSMDWRPTSETV